MNTCHHGVDWDADCAECNAVIARAEADGATTPHEIGLWEKGYEAGHKRGGAA